jgi:hypothetical protein
MLWYKGWLETRLRVVFVLGLMVLWTYLIHGTHISTINTGFGVIYLVGSVAIEVLTFCMLLAGAGIATQPPFQATKGLHGSMLFTLSLPVSRLRLLAVRATLGWLEMSAVVGIFCSGIWLFSPPIRALVAPVVMFEYAATLIACATSIYCLSVLLATFLDDQWRVWGTLIAVASLWWLSHKTAMPAFADILRAMSKGSPLVAHTMPWPAISFSLALAAAFLGAALTIVRTREY